MLAAAGRPLQTVRADGLPDHLVVSEVVTGGASASDEFIEIYNPTAGALPLEGLELIYVTASGATISRRAAWELGAATLGPGRHLLVANELGAYAGIADALYASGMAATGGSVAIRIQGASSAVDAVGWGSAASTWLEGQPAPAPAAGSSLERLPGGALGSTVDSDDNVSDVVARAVPEPQNVGSAPVPEPGTTPPPSSTPPASAPPTPSAAPTPGPETLPIAIARALPDGATATIEGTALSHSDFTDGGGFVADTSGGIAVLVTGATFARGDRLRLSGTIDDRFSQRTLRVEAGGLTLIGAGAEPSAVSVSTGAIGEGVEGTLARVRGAVVGAPSELSTGLAFDLDDGSGPTRMVVATATGIDVTAWEAGTRLDLVGIVGQRDSTGSGTTGYRVHPRATADVLAVDAAPSGTPQPSGSGSADPSPSAAPPPGVISIAAVRALPKNARARVRGTVTLAPGVVDPTTAVLQDGSGAIVVRIGEEVGSLSRGETVQVDGVRSTKSGMETLRATATPIRLARVGGPSPRALKTGNAGERDEAMLVVVRGGLVASARRSSTGSVSFELDDGSGPLRVTVGASVGVEHGALAGGTWLEVTGILGQDTTGAQPLRGYRVWPRDAADLRLLATPTDAAAGSGASNDASGDTGAPASNLEAIGGPAGDSVRIGATLVSGAWPELGIGGLLWDGSRLAALAAAAAPAVDGLLGSRRPPISVELSGIRAVGKLDDLGLPIVRIGDQPDAFLAGATAPAGPATGLPGDGDEPRWVAVVGRVAHRAATLRLVMPGGRSIDLDVRCATADEDPVGIVGVHGIAAADPSRIVVPCGGVRAAPSLGRAGAVPASADTPATAARLAGMGGAGEEQSSLPIVSAALLVLAALGLLGGGFVARRSGRDDPDPGDSDATSTDEAAPEHAPPALTLVPLPRDRAP
jgi:hypothetical protein